MKKCLENWKYWYNCLRKLVHLVISPHIVISITIIPAGGKLGRRTNEEKQQQDNLPDTDSREKADLLLNRQVYFNMYFFKL